MSAHPHAREKGGGAQTAQLVPCPSAPGADPNSLPRTASPRRVPEAGGEVAAGAPATSGPCLTLFAASPRPAARQPAAALRGPESESRGTAGAPSGWRDTGPAPPHPLLALVTSPPRRRRARTLTRTPLHLLSKVPVPGFPGMGAELRRPQRQSLRLTSRGGGRGGGSPVEEGRGAGGASARAGETWRRGWPGRRLRGRRGELGLGPSGGSEQNSSPTAGARRGWARGRGAAETAQWPSRLRNRDARV